MKTALGACKIEGAERLVEKHRPTGCSDQPGNRDRAAVGSQLIAAWAAAHPVGGPAPVELRTDLTQTEQWRASSGKINNAALAFDLELLNQIAGSRLN